MNQDKNKKEGLPKFWLAKIGTVDTNRAHIYIPKELQKIGFNSSNYAKIVFNEKSNSIVITPFDITGGYV